MNDYEENDKDKYVFDTEIAISKVKSWMAHQLRGVRQNKANNDVYNLLNNTTSIWIRDWTQKVLPQMFRKSQRNYFAKKGINVHVDVFLFKEEEGLRKAVCLTVLENCPQDLANTLVVADIVLQQFCADFPHMSDLYLRSDNAKCYSGNSAAPAAFNICKKNGFLLKRWDYPEA